MVAPAVTRGYGENMLVIGLGGPPGSGKSAVAEFLARTPGVEWIDLDRVAWELYRPGSALYDKLITRFGREITESDGRINRKKLGRIVFSDPHARADLDAIVHPAVGRALQEIIVAERANGTRVLLVEGALLGVSPHIDYSLFDAVIWLTAPREVRRERLTRAGRENHVDRVPDRPVSMATIVNATGTIADTAEQVRKLITRLGKDVVDAEEH